jgi:hypothetical protein
MPSGESRDVEEWVREFDEMLASFDDIDAPEIPLEELRRERLYEDRGL